MAVTIPESFAELVRARLSLLTDEQRRVLIALALVGEEPDWSLAAAVTDLDEQSALSAARAAADAHLLVVEKNRLRWRHAFTREAVLGIALPPEWSGLAHRAAAALRARGGDDDESAAAELLAAAGDLDGAAGIRLRQVARDITKGAIRSAEQRLSQLSKTGSLPVQVAMERVRLYTLTGDANRALEVGAAALDSSIGQEHAELCLRLARSAIVARRWGDAEEYVRRAGRPDDARSSVLLAEAAHGAGQIDVAIDRANRAVEGIQIDQHPEVLCEALCIVGRLARLRDADAAARRSAEPARSPPSSGFGRGGWRLSSASALQSALSWSGRHDSSMPATWRWTLDC